MDTEAVAYKIQGGKVWMKLGEEEKEGGTVVVLLRLCGVFVASPTPVLVSASPDMSHSLPLEDYLKELMREKEKRDDDQSRCYVRA